MLDDISMYKKYSPEEGIMAPDMIKDMIKNLPILSLPLRILKYIYIRVG